MNPRFDIASGFGSTDPKTVVRQRLASGKYMSGFYHSATSINRQPKPLIAKEKKTKTIKK